MKQRICIQQFRMKGKFYKITKSFTLKTFGKPYMRLISYSDELTLQRD